MIDILLYTDHTKGHVFPTFAIAKKLMEHGYSVAYAGIADTMELVGEYGFETYTIFEDVFPRGCTNQGKKPSPSLENNPSLLIMKGRLDGLMAKLQPRLIMATAHNPLESLVLYYKYKIQSVLIWSFFPIEAEFRNPMFNPYLNRIKESTIEVIHANASPYVINFFIQFAEQQGFRIKNLSDLVEPFEYFWHFITCPKAFLRHSIPPRKKEIYLGPGHFEIHKDRRLLESLEVDKFDGKQLIYCSLGSIPTYRQEKALKLFGFLIDCLSEPLFEDYALLISAGSLESQFADRNSANVQIAKWVPESQLLEQVACAIIHGGLGSVKECIKAQVPMLVHPLATDQFDNAKRIDFHNIGFEVDLLNMSKASLKNYLLQCTQSTSVQSKLKAMHRLFERENEKNIASKTIQSIIPMRAKITSDNGVR